MTPEPLQVPLAWRTPGMPPQTIDLHPEPVPPRQVGTAYINITPEIPEALRRYVASRETGPGARVVETTNLTGDIPEVLRHGGYKVDPATGDKVHVWVAATQRDNALFDDTGWTPLGYMDPDIQPVEHEPADTTTDVAEFGTLAAEIKGGTPIPLAPDPSRKYRVRYERPGRPPLYGTLHTRTFNPDTGQMELKGELAPEYMRAELAEMWGDPVPGTEEPAPAKNRWLTPEGIADLFDVPLDLITPTEETTP